MDVITSTCPNLQLITISKKGPHVIMMCRLGQKFLDIFSGAQTNV